jgi:GNAT superfamily N-acetyltransferase
MKDKVKENDDREKIRDTATETIDVEKVRFINNLDGVEAHNLDASHKELLDRETQRFRESLQATELKDIVFKAEKEPSPEDFSMRAYKKNGQEVGHILTSQEIISGNKKTQIEDFYVQESERDRGIGGRLLKEANDDAWNKGSKEIYGHLTVRDAPDANARDKLGRFYEKHGYEVIWNQEAIDNQQPTIGHIRKKLHE